MDIFLQQIINGLVLGSMYALVALGYTMVYGIIELINFAHGDLFMLGSFAALASFPVYIALRGVPTALEVGVFGWLVAPIESCRKKRFPNRVLGSRPSSM